MNDYFEELTKQQIEQWNKAESEPKLLFKFKSFYTSLDLARLCDGLKNNYLYFPTVKQLNDSLEGRGTHLFIGSDAEKYESNDADDYRVLSLSESCFSPVMWSHYGNNRTGICLGFYKGNPLDSTNQSAFKDAEKVQYVDSINMFSCDEKFAVMNDLHHKHIDWQYEKEWRYIAGPRNCTEKCDVCSKKGTNNCEAHFNYEEADLACIIFGENADEKIKQLIIQFADNVSIFSCKHDSKGFSYYLSPIGNAEDKRIYTIEELYKFLREVNS